MKDKQERFEQIASDIVQKKKQIIDLIETDNYKVARKVFAKLTALNKQYEKLKKEIQGENITDRDIQELRSITPKRKSVQNMTNIEIAKTPKFEKLLYTELGEKSPYEMRSGKLDWRNDSSKTVPVVEVQKRIIPENLAELRKDKSIPRGKFVNRDTGIVIVFGKPSIEEITAKAIQDDKRSIPVEVRMSALYQMREIVENSTCFDSQLSEYDKDTSRNKSPNTLFMHKFYGIMDCHGEKYLTDLSVEESYSTNRENQFRDTSNRIYNFKDIKITPIEANRIFNPAVPNKNVGEDTSTGVTVISIPQLYQIVKTYDKSFFENPSAIGRVDRESEQKMEEKFGEAEAKLQATEELVEALHSAEKFKTERDILRAKIDEVNEILEENPLLKSEYKAARDKHRKPPRDHHLPPKTPKH